MKVGFNLNYYKEHSKEYILKTKDIDMSEAYEFFLKYAKTGKLLDVGFGSGRDMLYFKSIGFDVEGIDSQPEFVDEALKLGLTVSCVDILDCCNQHDEYDYIWASASLLHIKKELLNQAFQYCSNMLKEDGIMYCSFKYGDFEGIVDDRYYINLTEETINNYLKGTNLNVIDVKITNDELKRNNKWLNVILKKVEL